MKLLLPLLLAVFIVSCVEPVSHDQQVQIEQDTIVLPELPVLDSVPEHHRAQITKYFNRFIRKRRFNGQILVAKGNNVILDSTCGYSNMRRRIPLKSNESMQLASITKPITATVILQLIEEGKIKVTDSVTKFLPDLPEHYQRITIDHLLSHRSGLSQYYYYCDAMMDEKEEMIYNDTVLCVIDFHNPGHYFPPGRKHNYCNTNYLLLASIIEAIENDRYPNVVKKRIFDQCDMTNSFVIDVKKDSLPSNLVFGHTDRNRIFEFDYLDGIVGDKGVFSNANDLYKFDRYLHKCGMINDSLVAVAQTPHNKIRHNASYGYGWRLRFHDKLGKIVYHTGWWHGNRHVYFKVPGSDYTVIILSNALRGSVYSLTELIDVFDFKEPEIKKEEIDSLSTDSVVLKPEV